MKKTIIGLILGLITMIIMCIIAITMYFVNDDPKTAIDILFISAMTIVGIILMIFTGDLIAHIVETRRINKIFKDFNESRNAKKNN